MIPYKNLLLSLILLVLLASCGVQYDYTRVKSTSLTPDVVRLNMNLSDFEVLGETEISVDYRTYLGFIRANDSINHKAYDRRVVNKVSFAGNKDFCLPSYLKKAAYKVTETFPNADYYAPVYVNKKVLRMFLGRRTERTMVIKAYKLK